MTSNESYQDIIPPVDRALIESELTEERFVKVTNKGGNKIYIVNHFNAPNTMLEIGRLRELAFRFAGGGTGLEVDIDEADTDENHYYEQLIVYNADDREIVGGYRFITGERARDPKTGEYYLSTEHYFDFSEEMKNDYLPYSIELGRSWVQPDYQPAINMKKGIFSLMNIWDGLGCLTLLYPEIKYFFGKVTMYTHYNSEARDLLLSFMDHYFPARYDLCAPKPRLRTSFDTSVFNQHFTESLSYKEGYKLLNKLIKERGEFIPPLFSIYMSLSETMITFGTARNPDFGDVEETGILVTIADILPEVIDRHIKY
jgi:hypothetical protein